VVTFPFVFTVNAIDAHVFKTVQLKSHKLLSCSRAMYICQTRCRELPILWIHNEY